MSKNQAQIISEARRYLTQLNTTNTKRSSVDIDEEEIYIEHARMIELIANILLAPQGRKFQFDEFNKDVFKFLLLYFNGSRKASDIFPKMKHTLDKNILLIGDVGTGKTLAMQVFSIYLKATNNKRHKFSNVSVTQMINYYQKHNHIDAFTYRENGAKGFEGTPVNICLNDVGLHTHKHFGQDTKKFIEDFLHARNEIWTQDNKFAHITTNLTPGALKEYFSEKIVLDQGEELIINRLNDRFKTYNVVYLMGKSRR